jgi:hypothetical protein
LGWGVISKWQFSMGDLKFFFRAGHLGGLFHFPLASDSVAQLDGVSKIRAVEAIDKTRELRRKQAPANLRVPRKKARLSGAERGASPGGYDPGSQSGFIIRRS